MVLKKIEKGKGVNKHLLFLDADLARCQVEKALYVPYENEQQLRQFCYYLTEGQASELDIENPYLVGIPLKQFTTFFTDYIAYPLPDDVILSEEELESCEVISDQVRGELEQVREGLKAVLNEIESLRKKNIFSSLFTQPFMALWMARQQHLLNDYHPYVQNLQVCYAIGEPPENETNLPPNLVFLPENRLVETMVEKGYSIPEKLVISPFDSEGLITQGEMLLKKLNEAAKAYRQNHLVELIQLAHQWHPDFSEGTWRVLIPSSRYTTVMRYALSSMARAFESLGVEVMLLSDSELSSLDAYDFLRAYIEFKPHFIFNINNLSSELLSEDVYEVIWWQDLMPPLLKDGQELKRRRTLHYAFGDYIYDRVVAAGGHNVEYQVQCADASIYYPPEVPLSRREVIVFVGSSYIEDYESFVKAYGQARVNNLFDDFYSLLYGSIENDTDRVEHLHAYISRSGIKQEFLTRLLIYYTRNSIIDALIKHAPIPVELYGYGWDKQPHTAPYYKGVVENGPQLAELYRNVQYGLSLHPFLIGHQRLAEIALCGATPLVLWTPNQYEPTDYKNEVVAFDTPENLIDILKSKPVVDPPLKIQEYFSYTLFAQRVLTRIMHELQDSQS